MNFISTRLLSQNLFFEKIITIEYIRILILKYNKETINLLDVYCYGSLDYNNYTKLEENQEKRINITSSLFNNKWISYFSPNEPSNNFIIQLK